MNKLNNSVKPIWITAIVLFIIAFVLALTGTIFMFNDYTTNTISSYNYNRTVTYASPETGIMPLFGTLMIIASVITFGVSYVKNKKLSILTIIFITIGQVLFYTSVVLATSTVAYTGWIFCVSAAAMLTPCKILTIIYLVIGTSKNSDKPAQDDINSFDIYDKCADFLLKMKALKDDGILTEEEFVTEKKKILQKYNIASPDINSFSLEGEYISDGTSIVIKSNAYIFVLDGKVIKSGDVEYNESNNTVTLKNAEGNQGVFSVNGIDLISKTGVVYKKK